jgi:hypothetical protein
MENLDQIFRSIPLWLSLILAIIFIVWTVLWFLVPFMIYSLCRRVKTIEWNMNYILFGDKKQNTRKLTGNWRDGVVEWVIALVERRAKERGRRDHVENEKARLTKAFEEEVDLLLREDRPRDSDREKKKPDAP